uniref:Glycylpeptide N-tetradecanoyltransferase n=1 Tax=Timema poppense TaxID=170557 RepID=A0A7R9H388_TIMPO|nr:unnamed protein product [Timema poppensis]
MCPRYWHRSLNPKKLIEVKFSHLSRNMTLQRTLKLYKLPEKTKTPGFRKLTENDLPRAHKLVAGWAGNAVQVGDSTTLLRLLTSKPNWKRPLGRPRAKFNNSFIFQFLERFDLAPIFTEEEFRHWFLPQSGIVDCFTVDSGTELTDLVSYYTLPSTVMHHPTHKMLKAAYSFYNVSTKTGWLDLMSDALVSAKNNGFDVFNALDLMENKEFLEELKFGIGDGNLQYYLYNWRCPPVPPQKVIHYTF